MSEMKPYFAKCLAGLEPLLEQELIEFGCSNVKPVVRGVEFETDYKGMVKANMASRFAIRILSPWWEGNSTSPEDLYEQAKSIPWHKILHVRQTFAIGSTVSDENFPHSQYAGLKLKDAIADSFRARSGNRPNVDKENPDLRIDLQIYNGRVRISLDTTGDSLHRRGYRPTGARAPLNECLAAAMIKFSGWTPDVPLYIPMCGSGTLVMEAAMMDVNLPSQWFRQGYGFMNWADFDRKAVEEVRMELWKQRRDPQAVIFASDKDKMAIEQTQQCVSKMSWRSNVTIDRTDFFALKPGKEGGIMILNPPYGERMHKDNINEFYRFIGQKLKVDFAGYSAWVISSNFEAMNQLGFRPNHKHTLYNGQLECKYYGFSLYEGSRKEKDVSQKDA